MFSQSATLTSKGQITIPAKIIKSANLKKGHKLSFSLENGIIRMESFENMINRIAGSLQVPKKYQGVNLDKMIQLAKEEHFSNYKP